MFLCEVVRTSHSWWFCMVLEYIKPSVCVLVTFLLMFNILRFFVPSLTVKIQINNLWNLEFINSQFVS